MLYSANHRICFMRVITFKSQQFIYPCSEILYKYPHFVLRNGNGSEKEIDKIATITKQHSELRMYKMCVLYIDFEKRISLIAFSYIC